MLVTATIAIQIDCLTFARTHHAKVVCRLTFEEEISTRRGMTQDYLLGNTSIRASGREESGLVPG